jgi:hypothetical protein
MDEQKVLKSRVSHTVRARIKTRRGGQYIVLGKLVEVNEEGIKIMTCSRLAEESDLQDVRSYPWDRVVSVEPLVP